MYIVNVCWDASQKGINVLQYGSTVNVITGDAECNSPMFGIFLTPLTLTIQCQWSLKYHRTTEQPGYYWLLVTTIPAGLFIY